FSSRRGLPPFPFLSFFFRIFALPMAPRLFSCRAVDNIERLILFPRQQSKAAMLRIADTEKFPSDRKTQTAILRPRYNRGSHTMDPSDLRGLAGRALGAHLSSPCCDAPLVRGWLRRL